ncbi:MAG: serine/threonine protein kinase, partial [Syntrophobacteraceae bacterium]
MSDKIFNFILRQVLAKTPNANVYRVENDGGTAVLKVLRTGNPSVTELARFKQEYTILKGLKIEGIVCPIDIIESGEGIAILEKDYAGLQSLKDVIKKKKKLDPGEFLRVAISVSQTMGELHSKNIIHKDLKPANILVDPAMETAKITGWGISSILFSHDEEIFRRDVIEETLVYMSPEKTGRTNRDLDYRTDLYSMGVTFYEALTGSLPFISDDPMEIIHAHIARKPLPAMEMDISIPEVLSEIIDKLLCKTPEERYQSGFGVMHDLKLCLKAHDAQKPMEPFPLALMDISAHFNIPQVLIGRQSELDTLLSAFDRFVDGKRETILVRGRPGIGKSALVNEIRKPVLARRGYFISGKYDQL